MSRSIVINTGATSPKSALFKSRTDRSPGQLPEFTLGDSSTFNLYLQNSDSTRDATTLDGSPVFKVGLGVPGATPKSGTYTLTFGGQTTSALSFDSTAAQVQTALLALSSINAGNVLVNGAFPDFEIQFVGALAAAPQTLLTADASRLFPISDVNCSHVQIGTASPAVNAIQAFALQCQAVTLTTTWTSILETATIVGFTGVISFATDGLAELFPVNSPQITAVLEIRVNGQCIASPVVTIYNRVLDAATTGQGPVSNFASGTFAIGNGVDNVTVTGLGLANVPRLVMAWIIKPPGGFNLYPTYVDGTLATTGFHVELSGVTDNSNYKLGYALFF